MRPTSSISPWQRLLLAAAIGAGFAGFAGTAAAADLVDAKDPSRLLAMAREQGTARLTRDEAGDPRIVVKTEQGTMYAIDFYGCVHGKDCDDITFRASWGDSPATIETVNRWNAQGVYGKAFLDREGDPVLTMSVDLNQGVAAENLQAQFVRWSEIIRAFEGSVVHP